MMVVYRFSPLTPGAAVRITDAEGATVDEGTTNGAGVYTVELDAGNYVATTDPTRALGHTTVSGVAVASDGDVWTFAEDAAGYVPLVGASASTPASIGFWGGHATVETSLTEGGLQGPVEEYAQVVFVPGDVDTPDEEDPIVTVNAGGNLVVPKAGLYALSLTGEAGSADQMSIGTATIDCRSEDESLKYYQANFDLTASEGENVSSFDIVEAFTADAFLPWGNPGNGGWMWFTYTTVAFTAGQVLKTFVTPGSDSTDMQVLYDIYPILYL